MKSFFDDEGQTPTPKTGQLFSFEDGLSSIPKFNRNGSSFQFVEPLSNRNDGEELLASRVDSANVSCQEGPITLLIQTS